MDIIRAEGSDRHDFLCFDNGQARGLGHDGTKGFCGISKLVSGGLLYACRFIPKHAVALLIGFPCP
jgi:hypothetical protein